MVPGGVGFLLLRTSKDEQRFVGTVPGMSLVSGAGSQLGQEQLLWLSLGTGSCLLEMGCVWLAGGLWVC